MTEVRKVSARPVASPGRVSATRAARSWNGALSVRSFPLEEYRRNIGIVLQEPFLFFGTIAENIAYGRPDASREEIIAAARAARAHEFILRLTALRAGRPARGKLAVVQVRQVARVRGRAELLNRQHRSQLRMRERARLLLHAKQHVRRGDLARLDVG